ncbi:hypothetical protein Aaci_2985 (plasmid) [Alicyclobacillus acidocaldarius subsp. acidocaldarius DSM 446]|uniref:Uncharacterized protein n=1 Tax=Alicyclobacillus acidocaldarius subsp. acidocaldarius (strain ATCC 27009 / DSM 446 / BCRC 14685 / JCM 5260 / KCTC 1825 / NBRC 15652 / NCIMB 11725 / NRRL B-14509 / 104-IA) TaxID=521098 RepID=C8WY94_ALIAD|nr:hypothetical protein Aaci_2985 [Alicyclobacillus acidocaldarius subsp. acidocaldarius DSM 446]
MWVSVYAYKGTKTNEAEFTRRAKKAVECLERQMPALVGPHADRPWVKYVLRELSRIPSLVA